MKEKTTPVKGSPLNKWDSRTVKSRRNAIAVACGLESTFIPRWVLESLKKDKNGEVTSVFSGRDGRILWSGKTKLVRYPDKNQKFTQPWRYAPPGFRRKAVRFSQLLSDLAETGLSLKTIRPLTRLALQFWKLKFRDFKATVKSVRTSLSTVVRRRPPVHLLQTVKPTLTGKEKTTKLYGLEKVPLWDYVPL